MKFKIGDRVKVVKNESCMSAKDKFIGKEYVIENEQGCDALHGTRYGIGQTHIVYESEIVPIVNTSKILITTDGVTTTARLYDGKKVVRSKEAKCAPSDTFSFNTGANLAYSRLMNTALFGIDLGHHDTPVTPKEDKPEPKPRFKAGDKVKVTKNGQSFTTYKTWFSFNNISFEITRQYAYGKTVDNGSVCTVVACGEHERKGYDPMYAIQGGGGSVYLIGENGLEPYAEPANKYEAMSDDELYSNVCHKGGCSTRSGRHADCPLYHTPTPSGCFSRLADSPEMRSVLIQYCLDEDAAKEAVKPKEMTVAEIEKELGYPVKVVKGAK